jgi:hypothetical protein
MKTPSVREKLTLRLPPKLHRFDHLFPKRRKKSLAEMLDPGRKKSFAEMLGLRAGARATRSSRRRASRAS